MYTLLIKIKPWNTKNIFRECLINNNFLLIRLSQDFNVHINQRIGHKRQNQRNHVQYFAIAVSGAGGGRRKIKPHLVPFFKDGLQRGSVGNSPGRNQGRWRNLEGLSSESH